MVTEGISFKNRVPVNQRISSSHYCQDGTRMQTWGLSSPTDAGHCLLSCLSKWRTPQLPCLHQVCSLAPRLIIRVLTVDRTLWCLCMVQGHLGHPLSLPLMLASTLCNWGLFTVTFLFQPHSKLGLTLDKGFPFRVRLDLLAQLSAWHLDGITGSLTCSV